MKDRWVHVSAWHMPSGRPPVSHISEWPTGRRFVEICREEKHTPQKEKNTKRTYREIDSTPTVSEERKNSSEARDSLCIVVLSVFSGLTFHRSLHNFIVGLCFGRFSPALRIGTSHTFCLVSFAAIQSIVLQSNTLQRVI